MGRTHTVDIGGLIAGNGRRLVIDDEITLEPFEGVAFPEPTRVQLTVRCVDRILEVEGTVDTTAHGECDACLEDVVRAIHVDVDERLDPAVDRNDDPFGEGNVLSGSRLDVADLAQQVILSALPMGLRCKDECAGLCGTCGMNLNAGACSCNNGEDRGKSQVENTAQ